MLIQASREGSILERAAGMGFFGDEPHDSEHTEGESEELVRACHVDSLRSVQISIWNRAEGVEGLTVIRSM